MPTVMTPDKPSRLLPSIPKAFHPIGPAPRTHRRFNSSWSGSLSSIVCTTQSSNPDQNAILFPSKTTTPIQRNTYKVVDPPRSRNKRPNGTPLASRSNPMPVSSYPHTMDSYQYATYGGYADGYNTDSPRSPFQAPRHAMSATSNPTFYYPAPHYDHGQFASAAYFSSYPHELGADEYSFHDHSRPSYHRRSRSDSFSVPGQTYRTREGGYSTGASSSSGGEGYDSARSHGHARSHSSTQIRSVRPRRSSLRQPLSDSESYRLRDTRSQGDRRVRFVIPASLHSYLSYPPFRISIKGPPPQEVIDYHHRYLSLPATRPTISFMLITTPYLPWTIRLGAQPVASFPSSRYHDAPLAYLSAYDVLYGIYLALREYITPQEYESLSLEREFRHDVLAAFRRRKAQEERAIPGTQEWMRRIDWLAGRTVFEGLESSNEGEGVWKLRLGWKKNI